MTTGLIVFCRLDSRRLPGKALLDLAGRPLLGRVLDRVHAVPGARPVVVATSDRAVDEPIVDFCRAEGVEVFRGPADDVMGRALACAEAYRFTRFARVCGDSPFVLPTLVDSLIEAAEREALDLVTNTFPRSYPAGLSVEIVATDALARACGATADPQDREHVTRYFYSNPGHFRIRNVSAPVGGCTDVHLAVDRPEDLERAAWIARRMREEPGAADLAALVRAARGWRAAVAGPAG